MIDAESKLGEIYTKNGAARQAAVRHEVLKSLDPSWASRLWSPGEAGRSDAGDKARPSLAVVCVLMLSFCLVYFMTAAFHSKWYAAIVFVVGYAAAHFAAYALAERSLRNRRRSEALTSGASDEADPSLGSEAVSPASVTQRAVSWLYSSVFAEWELPLGTRGKLLDGALLESTGLSKAEFIYALTRIDIPGRTIYVDASMLKNKPPLTIRELSQYVVID